MIDSYFSQFDKIINQTDFIISSEIEMRKVNDFLGLIEGKIILQGGTLDILEVIRIKEEMVLKKKYKYHFRKMDNTLIFRYDNAPHHQGIETFPHHKHLANQSVIASQEPDLVQVLLEIKEQE